MTILMCFSWSCLDTNPSRRLQEKGTKWTVRPLLLKPAGKRNNSQVFLRIEVSVQNGALVALRILIYENIWRCWFKFLLSFPLFIVFSTRSRCMRTFKSLCNGRVKICQHGCVAYVFSGAQICMQSFDNKRAIRY